MKLISMTDYVLDLSKNGYKEYEKIHTEGLFPPALKIWICKKVVTYAKFLKQPLKIEMFVPCDEEGNVLEKPIFPKYFDPTEPVPEEVEQEFYNYDKSKEKVLFEGFDFIDGMLRMPDGGDQRIEFLRIFTIEDLIRKDLTLTPSAINQLAL